MRLLIIFFLVGGLLIANAFSPFLGIPLDGGKSLILGMIIFYFCICAVIWELSKPFPWDPKREEAETGRKISFGFICFLLALI